MPSPGIGFWLSKREMLNPDKEALIDESRRFTYRELNQRVNRLANVLTAQGLTFGDRCAILAYNCAEFVELIFAAAKLGVILVPLNWRLSPVELAYNINDSGATLIVFDAEFESTVNDLRQQTSISQFITIGKYSLEDAPAYDDLLKRESSAPPVPSTPVDLNTAHIIMYTAGTTGRPKGAVLSQGASFYNALNLMVDMNFTSQDRNLSVLPMFHIGGIGLFTLPMIYVGGTVVIQRTFEPATTLALLQKEGITLFFGVAAIFLFLIQHADFDPRIFDAVRVVMSGGAPLPVSLVRQYHQAGILLQQGFGMSEAAPSVATLSRDSALKKAGSIGRPLLHTDARVVDEQLNPLPPNTVGELVIRGPNLLLEYWNRPEATREAFSGDWFHTGDLARMDSDGDLYIVDRKKDMFISGGENVYPAEVENAIYEMEQVAEAAVIGLKDKKWGEIGCALVTLKSGENLNEKDIIEFLKTRLARFKVPKRIVFIDAPPRNAAGKVLKNELRNQYQT